MNSSNSPFNMSCQDKENHPHTLVQWEGRQRRCPMCQQLFLTKRANRKLKKVKEDFQTHTTQSKEQLGNLENRLTTLTEELNLMKKSVSRLNSKDITRDVLNDLFESAKAGTRKTAQEEFLHAVNKHKRGS